MPKRVFTEKYSQHCLSQHIIDHAENPIKKQQQGRWLIMLERHIVEDIREQSPDSGAFQKPIYHTLSGSLLVIRWPSCAIKDHPEKEEAHRKCLVAFFKDSLSCEISKDNGSGDNTRWTGQSRPGVVPKLKLEFSCAALLPFSRGDDFHKWTIWFRYRRHNATTGNRIAQWLLLRECPERIGVSFIRVSLYVFWLITITQLV